MKKEEAEMVEETKAPELEARQLHKTLSLFMRSVPPNISKADIHAVSYLSSKNQAYQEFSLKKNVIEFDPPLGPIYVRRAGPLVSCSPRSQPGFTWEIR